MNQYRCKKCHKLLMRMGKVVRFLENYIEAKSYALADSSLSVIEIKCAKCKIINRFEICKEQLVY